MPSAPSSASSRESAITSAVLYPPAPARTGTLPLASSTLICTTRRCSSCVSVGLSPVVPQGTRKSMPASICRLIKVRSVASSNDPSPRKGVTSAVPVPVNIVVLLLYLDILLPKPKLVASGRITRDPSTQLVQDFFELKKALFTHNPPRRLQCAVCKPFAASRGVPKRDCVHSRIKTDFVRAGMGASS